MRKTLYALAVCCTAPFAAAQCLPGTDAQSAPFPRDGEFTRVMGAGKHGAVPHPSEPTLISAVAAQPAVRGAPVGHTEVVQDKGKNAGEHGRSQSGTMLLTALAVMIAIALRRVGASA